MPPPVKVRERPSHTLLEGRVRNGFAECCRLPRFVGAEPELPQPGHDVPFVRMSDIGGHRYCCCDAALSSDEIRLSLPCGPLLTCTLSRSARPLRFSSAAR